MFGFKVISQYERGVVFRWGRALPDLREPGLTWVNPISDRLRKVNMQIIVAAIPAQQAITRDNVTLQVDAVVYYRVIDPRKAIINVQNYAYAISQVAQTSLRSVIGRSDMDHLLSERDKINAHLKDVIDAPTEEPWGIRVERVEVKDVSLPESMKRSMSRQAEAERERRARIISADGEFQASKKLAQAASVMSADPAALQLRLLQTVVEVAAEKNSTLVMPFPVELLRFFDRAAPAAARARPLPAEVTPSPPPVPVRAMPAAAPAGSLPAAAAVPTSLNTAPKTPARKTPALKAPVLKAPVLKAPVLKAPVLKAPVLKTPARKTPARRTPARKTPALKAPAPETAAPETAAPETAAPETAAMKTAAPETAAMKTAAMKTAAMKTAPPEAPNGRTPVPKAPSAS